MGDQPSSPLLALVEFSQLGANQYPRRTHSRAEGGSLEEGVGEPAEERRKAEEVYAEVLEGWLFTTPKGAQLDPNNIRKRVFYRVLDLAGLRRIRFHDLRHAFASLLIQQGESLAYVKDQLGHSSIQITVDTYGHLVPGGNIQAVDRLMM